MAPVISSVTRTGETSAIVIFSVPPSEQDAEYFEILLYTAGDGKVYNEVHTVGCSRYNNIMQHYHPDSSK